jgi:hypothetical protein
MSWKTLSGCAFGITVVSCTFLAPRVGPREQSNCSSSGSVGGYEGYGPDASATANPCSGATGDGGGNVETPDAGVTGNVLIADQFNNRVIEVTRQGDVAWSFGDGSSVPGPHSIVAPNDAERLPDGSTLMAGTGAPPGTEPACPADGGGCQDNRVLIVDSSGNIVWQYGANGGVSGSGPNQLNTPAAAVLVPTKTGDHILITDQGNNRIIEVDRASMTVAWQFPPTNPSADQMLNSPNSAQRLASGNTLIADENANRVIEVKGDGTIVWQYPKVVNTATLNVATFASRLASGNTLIADGNNNRVVEVDMSDPPNVVWTYDTTSRSTQGMMSPSHAVRLANGHTLITETFVDQVVEIDGTPQQNVVYTHGGFNVAGSGPNELNQAYAAAVVGDYTGLTPPTLSSSP